DRGDVVEDRFEAILLVCRESAAKTCLHVGDGRESCHGCLLMGATVRTKPGRGLGDEPAHRARRVARGRDGVDGRPASGAVGVSQTPVDGDRRPPDGVTEPCHYDSAAVVSVNSTNDSGSLTRKPYSASARTATRLCSHRLTREPLIVTVASVETS